MYSNPISSQQVLFQIDYDPCLLSRPYAPIADISHIPDENEVLFMPGTEFEVLNSSFDKFWTIHLKLRHNSSFTFSFENKERDRKNNIIRLKRFLPSYATKQNDVDIIFSKLLEIFPNEQRWLSAIKWVVIKNGY
ncbi:unnamed protein product [Adineta ricciae]|uniref:Uncharacterized protein n=1 Tax=Adineta ricciae TaxID=249248 RepID=A0A816HM78_ADIRI|nr:unnamed protein product [Adineta ricciae]